MSDEKNFNEENEEVTAKDETAETAVEKEETVSEETQTTDETAETAAEKEESPEEKIETATEEAIEAQVTAQAADIGAADNEIAEGTVIGNEGAEEAATLDEVNLTDTISKKNKKGALIAVIVAAVLVVALIVVGIVVFGSTIFNKYNRQGYVNVSGRTIGEVAEMMGMDLDEFLEQYDLPKDMPANTTEGAAYNNIPFSKMSEMYGMDTSKLKELLELPDDITDDTPWGEAVNQAPLGAYVGEEYLDSYKEYFGLGDEVNADTLWGEVRQTVEEKQKKERIESEKEAESTDAPEETPEENAAENPAEDAAETEAPAA